MRLLTWNLFHGRDCPPNPALRSVRSRVTGCAERDATHVQVNRSLRAEFAAALAGWEWDVALAQEASPRWLGPLERATAAAGVRDLTSRNSLGALRGWLADRNPDALGSWEGGSNMVLVRPPARIVATAAHTLAERPERRRLLLARVELAGGRRLTVACVHLSVPSTQRGAAEALRAAELAGDWAGGDPLVLGGDLNLRPADHAAVFAALAAGHGLSPPTSARAIDHLLVRGAELVEPPRALPAAEREVDAGDGRAIRLSDHAPVVAALGLR
ncbi:MAG: hypothetical protein GXY03_02040 [Solirubrobacterales bacterium]|nr:hypothetical protein [Solirubrobacterales bacterium]